MAPQAYGIATQAALAASDHEEYLATWHRLQGRLQRASTLMHLRSFGMVG